MGFKQRRGCRSLDLVRLRPLGPFIGGFGDLVHTASYGKWHQIALPAATSASARPAYTTSPMHSPYSWVPPTAARAQIATRRPSSIGPLRRPLRRPRLHRFLRHMAPPLLCISFIVEGSSPQISSFNGGLNPGSITLNNGDWFEYRRLH